LIIFEGRKSWEFKEVCMARGLLEDDHKWRICLEKAIAIQPGMACH